MMTEHPKSRYTGGCYHSDRSPCNYHDVVVGAVLLAAAHLDVGVEDADELVGARLAHLRLPVALGPRLGSQGVAAA